ncbi:TonB-dependent receptor [uncultured Bacteroides sp.]|uniref:TonB-dependent receptor n=1 Tax=uncultured Bacteroides sp. TaxID=162156 RepID=UPI002AA8069C|nr:TonB-dependent receptor [uncultured Bacteroides sp.]
MKKHALIFLVGILYPFFAYGQTVQNIRGTVKDESSQEPLPYASVVIQNTQLGTSTDNQGNFMLKNVPVGRYNLTISYLGYEPKIISEVMVSSSKEVILEITLKENISQIGEVTISPKVNKSMPLNKMATVSARMLSVEEASRYAGGFDDPARLASSFAGVGSNVGNNGIVVRGNAPKFLQWKLEDVEIPNPNHFADVTGFGGGGMTALSSQVLGNSDFFTGAFPAEYSNALSGVFDIKLKNGSNTKMENAVQLGLLGIDIASEGPFKKNGKASYIFNYRYSALALLSPLMPDDAGGTKYQDLSFKVNMPTTHAGVFSIWGLGLIDRSGQTPEKDIIKWEYLQDKEEEDVKQYMGVLGIQHKISVGTDAYLKSTLATTVSGLNMHTERMNDNIELQPKEVIRNTNYNFVFATALNKKFNAKHSNKTGIQVTGLLYDMLLKNADPAETPLKTQTDENGFSTLLTAYTNSSINLSDRWTLNVGIAGQYFTLNKHYTIEPRVGIKWGFAENQSLGIAYGLHSRLELLNYYFTRSESGELVNKDLDFTRAHHLVLSYNLNIGSNYHLQIESYIQKLYDVPVIPDSSYSFINLQKDWFVNKALKNNGKGINYGIDVTLEKYISRGYYFMFTGSLFNSRYQGGDGVWRNTRFNRNYLLNFLSGKEWMVGKNKQNVFNVNLRLSYQGGDRYSPIDQTASARQEDAVYDERNAFSKQLAPALLGHFNVSYKINQAKRSHEFALKILNATGYKEYYGYRYNFKTHRAEQERESIIIPNISYKIEF